MTLKQFSALIALASQTCPVIAIAACPATQRYDVPDGDQTRQVSETGAFVFFRAGLRVNTDGAANSYHPIGRSAGALNTICNGIAVYPSSGPHKGERISSIAPGSMDPGERCQTILNIFRESRNANYAFPNSGTISWYALAMEPGAAPAGYYRPCIQKSGQYAGFFVAQTAKPADASKPVCDPAHWMSSTEIPYITLPSGSRAFAAAKVGVGDLALVYRHFGGKNIWVTAIVADTGNRNELGEGSIALHHALGNPTVGIIPLNLPADVVTFIFKKSEPAGAISSGTLTGAQDGLIAKAGGMLALNDCVNNSMAK